MQGACRCSNILNCEGKFRTFGGALATDKISDKELAELGMAEWQALKIETDRIEPNG